MQHCFHCEPDVWRLHVQSSDGPSIIEARWVVDASGRSSWLARRLGATRFATDRLLSLVKWLPSDASTERRTLIEACETGWWYSAKIPGCRTVIAYFTDIDLLPRNRSERTAEWNAKFSLTSLMSGVYGKAADERAHCFAAASEHVVQCAGRRWIAVGDAEASIDPLSGQGIMNALTSALDGAAFIAERIREGSYVRVIPAELAGEIRPISAVARGLLRQRDALAGRSILESAASEGERHAGPDGGS